MSNLLDMRFKIAVLGNLKNGESNNFNKNTFNLVHEIKSNLTKYNSRDYGFNEKEVILDFYSCPVFSDEIWEKVCTDTNTTLNFIIPNDDYSDSPLINCATSVTNLNVGIHNIGTTRSMIKWMINQIDLAILLWDGREYSDEGYMWSFIEECKYAKIPCIWIEKSNCENIYWFNNFFNIKYESKYLGDYIANIYKCVVSSSNLPEKNIIFSKFWGLCYNHFINKNKIAFGSIENVEDELIKKEFKLDFNDEEKNINYDNLKEAFINYDKKALNVAKYYRESVYFRSILPFISTIFLALGFYTETIASFLFFPADSFRFPILSIIAGVGFLIHAFINCYGFYIDEEKNIAVKKRKEVFLDYRYTAEYIRNMIHFLPFGIPVKYTVTNNFDLNNKSLTEEAKTNIHNIMRSMTPTGYSLSHNNYLFVVEKISNMIDSQLSYHKFKIEQMGKISNNLKKIRDFVFWTGFIIVLLRGGLQFSIAFVDKSRWIEQHGISLKSFISSSANMLALLLPGWYMYFSNKLSMNNFKGLTDHSLDVVESLKNLKEKTEIIKKQNDISYEMVSSLSEDVFSHQMAELNDWYTQTMKTKITKL